MNQNFRYLNTEYQNRYVIRYWNLNLIDVASVQSPYIDFCHINQMPEDFLVPTFCFTWDTVKGNESISKVNSAHAFIVLNYNCLTWCIFVQFVFLTLTQYFTHWFDAAKVGNKLYHTIINPLTMIIPLFLSVL